MSKPKQTLDADVVPRIRGPFDREAVDTKVIGESLTHQSFVAECDINNIMSRYEKGLIIEHVNRYQGDYGDFTDAPTDYAEALNQVMAAQEMFMSLPSKIRERFENDPGQFLAFVQDPENLEEMQELGLSSRPPSKTGEAGGEAGVDASPSGQSEGTPQASAEQT